MKYFNAYLNSVKNFVVVFGVALLFVKLLEGDRAAELYTVWSIIGGLFGVIRVWTDKYYE